jgi:hypothetical protein
MILSSRCPGKQQNCRDATQVREVNFGWSKCKFLSAAMAKGAVSEDVQRIEHIQYLRVYCPSPTKFTYYSIEGPAGQGKPDLGHRLNSLKYVHASISVSAGAVVVGVPSCVEESQSRCKSGVA